MHFWVMIMRDIPLCGRIPCRCLRCSSGGRVYKPPYSHERARCIIVEGKNTHFDSDRVDAY